MPIGCDAARSAANLSTSALDTVDARSKSGPCCVQNVPVPDMLAREYSFARDVT